MHLKRIFPPKCQSTEVFDDKTKKDYERNEPLLKNSKLCTTFETRQSFLNRAHRLLNPYLRNRLTTTYIFYRTTFKGASDEV